MGGVDAEATISISAGFDAIQWEGIQLYSWDTWLNSGTGRNKVVKERLQQVPQQTAASMAPVQRTVFCYSSLLIIRAMSTSANCSRNMVTSAVQWVFF